MFTTSSFSPENESLAVSLPYPEIIFVLWHSNNTLLTFRTWNFGLTFSCIEYFHMTSHRLRVVPLSLSPSCVTRKETARKNGRAKSWDSNSFLTWTLSFVPKNLYGFWPRAWKHSKQGARKMDYQHKNITLNNLKRVISITQWRRNSKLFLHIARKDRFFAGAPQHWTVTNE